MYTYIHTGVGGGGWSWGHCKLPDEVLINWPFETVYMCYGEWV